MKEQNYKNHIFYYLPHHLLYYGSVAVAFALCGWGFYRYPQQHMLWVMMAFAVFLTVSLSFMTRQHYALGNQNRTVRLEMRLRYYILTGKRLEEIERQLSFRHMAALRFAPDEELPALIDAAVSDRLSPGEIKRRIKKWLPDTMRV